MDDSQLATDQNSISALVEPKYTTMIIEKVRSLLPDTRLILFVTATNIETECLHKAIKAFTSDDNEIIQCMPDNNTYFIGRIGKYGVVHFQCDEQGSIAKRGAITTTGDALNTWHPDAAIMVGIAFGKDKKKHQIGDVLVSKTVFNYEDVKVEKDKVTPRSSAPESGTVLFNRFKNIQGWECMLENGKPAHRRIGMMISGEKLVSYEAFKQGLFTGNTEEAVGGDKESFGFHSAVSSHLSEWIVVKGISDWGDSNKGYQKDERQHIAASSAVSLCQKVLESSGLDRIHRNPDRVAAALAHAEVETAGSGQKTSEVGTYKNLPDRNLYFAGRKLELEQIEAAFTDGQRAVLTGNGGYGKTQIALEYAYQHLGDYQHIWWVNAESELSLQNDYREFAQYNGLSSSFNEEFDQVLRFMKRWFAENSGWLFVYDNAEGVKKLEVYLPGGTAKGCVLVTTRDTRHKIPGKTISTDVFMPDESRAFLKERLTESSVEVTDNEANQLADLLGHLPLALEQAAAYIYRHQRSLVEYINLFQKHGVRVLKGTEDEETVLTTWSISFGAIESVAAKQLFNVCAYLAPDDIPLNLLIDGREELPEKLQSELCSDEFLQDELLDELRHYSLISLKRENNDPLISIHRLVQQVVRKELGAGSEWLEFALNTSNAGYTYETVDVESASSFRLQLPHALEVAEQAEDVFTGEDNRRFEAASLFMKAGYGLHNQGDYPKALELHQKALAIKEEVLGDRHPSTAMTYSNIAAVYHAQGDYPKALEWNQKALAIKEEVLGDRHPDTATTYNNIAVVYHDQGDYPKAQEWYMRALVINEEVLGDRHPDTAKTYNNIATVYFTQGDYPKALEWYQKALAIYEDVLGDRHPDTATIHNNIASVYRARGDYPKALEWFVKALAINEEVLGDRHPSTAMSYNNIAAAYHAQGDYPEALEWFEKALAIYEEVLGDQHPDTATIYNNIASVYRAQGDYPKALEWYEKAQVINLEVLGPDHPHTQITKVSIESVRRKISSPE
ncbi:MAG: tetratricopeptide repeat protein [Coriobacteriales bacterium]|nr:tetratricopeptide repeat protein [Coriobacteriales bacterium]